MPEIPVSMEAQQIAVAAMYMIVVTAMTPFVAGPVVILNTYFMQLRFWVTSPVTKLT